MNSTFGEFIIRGSYMIVNDAYPYFRNRADAGRRLAEDLRQYRNEEVVVLAIPRGGVPVAVEVAKELGCQLEVVIPRKIPIPSNTEAGYGAVTEDGAIVLNEPLVRQLGFTRPEIERHAEEVKAEIKRRTAVFRTKLAPSDVRGKTAIIIDDGIASGYTMMAAIKSIRQRGAAKVVAAAPVASASAWELIKPMTDDTVCPIVAYTYSFAVASFYQHWHDLTDEEVFEVLEGFMKGDRGKAHKYRGIALQQS